MDTRRDFLRKAALLTAAASIPNVLPASIQKAMAINPAPGSTYLDAEHIVILMQENRSFDHMYGTLRGVRGYNDPRAITLPNKNLVWLQSNSKGETYAPFHLDIKNTKSTWMSCLPHNWDNQVNSRNDGKFDQWLNEKRSGNEEYADMPLTLGHNTRHDIPFYYALADAFTVCDQNFCSSLTGTDPNRLYFWSGTIRQQQNESSRPNVYNDDADYGKLDWPTFPERLEDNDISWKCYQNEVSIDVGFKGEEDPWLSNFGDNPLENFKQYNIKLYKKHVAHIKKRADEIPAEIAEQQKKINALPAGDPMTDRVKKKLHGMQTELNDIKKELADMQPGAFEKLSQREKNLHTKAFSSNDLDPDYHTLTTLSYDDNGTKREVKVPKGDVLHQLRHDVNTGNLPAVSWITAPQNFSDHPSAPWYGTWYLSEVIDILTQNPEVWKKTIFILAYDENDGYFDHVPPFVAPRSDKPGTGKVSKGIDTSVEFVTLAQELERKGFPEEFDRESPIGLGYRVPLVIASPWTRGGYVNSEVFDHTSTLQFLEHFLSHKTGKKVHEPNISDWRRTVCGDLSSVFRPYNGERITEPSFLKRDDVVEYIHNAKFKKLPSEFKLLTPDEIQQINNNPHSSPYFPKQEPGTKPSCALPYQLYADGRLSADKKSFEIKFEAANNVFGKATLGSPFNVYAPGRYDNENVHTWAYALKPGDGLSDQWPLHAFDNGDYHLRVYGPNGFFREYTGNAADPELDVSCQYQHSVSGNKLTGNIELKLHNLSRHAHHEIEIVDNAYKANHHAAKLKAGAVSALVLNLKGSHNWYDFTVRVKGSTHFMKRYTGRVETGLETVSDPFMGKVV
jgi:phospholipase C